MNSHTIQSQNAIKLIETNNSRICQIELKQRTESLTEELMRINDALQFPLETESYVKKLINIKHKITVVNNILQTTQERLIKIDQAVKKNTGKRKALLDHSTMYSTSNVTSKELIEDATSSSQ